jgi:tetratricopeptide (TPR) repeat protein
MALLSKLQHIVLNPEGRKAATAFNPSVASAVRLNYAKSLCESDKVDEAAAIYWSMVEADPYEIGAAINLADIWINQGKPADAAALLDVICGLAPDCSHAWCNLSAALSLVGDHEKAMVAANNAVKADVSNAMAFYNRAECWCALNQTRMSIRDFETANELDPANMEIAEKLSLARLAIQDTTTQPFGDVQHESKAHGAWIVDGIQVADTLQCPHCDMHFVSIRGSGVQRGYCGGCRAVTCGNSSCIPCVPYLKTLEDIAKSG